MNGTVTVYFNTGFNGVDIPAEPSVLEQATKKVYPDVYYIREDLDKPFIKIKDSYDNLCNVDYCKIETTSRTAYFFAVPEALSQGVTQLSLDLDALLTMGGAKNLDYSSGWQERGHITKAEDVLFENIASESWTPSQQLEAKHITMIESNKSEIEGQEGPANRDVIMCNVDLKSLENEAIQNAVEAIAGKYNGSNEMYMPGIPVPDYNNSTFFGVWDENPVPGNPSIPPETINYKIIGTAAYDLTNSRVRKAIKTLFSAGQLQLQSSYRIPGMYVDDALTKLEKSGETYDPDSDSGLYSKIVGYRQVYNANNLPYIYTIPDYTIKNKKVYDTYRSYIIVNLGSGDMSIKSPHEIYNSANPTAAPAVRMWADPVATGKPYARFDYIKDNPLQWADTVKGLQWANVQICLEGASGSMWNSISNAFASQNIERNQQQAAYDNLYSVKNQFISHEAAQIENDYMNAKSNLGIAGDFLGAIGNATAGVLSMRGLVASNDPSADLSKGLSGVMSHAKSYGSTWLNQQQANKMYQETLNKEFLTQQQRETNYGLQKAQLLQKVNENEVDLYKNNNVVAPTIMFTPEQNLGLYGYNKFAIYEVRKSDEDLKSEDMYYQRFGYSGLHRPLTGACFNTRQYYSYVQAFNINIKSNFGLRIRQKAINQLNQGVRVWKVLPDASYYETN